MSAGTESEGAVGAAEHLRRLLAKYRYFGQADYVAEALLFAEHEREEFLQRMASGDMWGSAGSVVDVIFEQLPGQPRAELERDGKRKGEYLIAIAEALDQVGRSDESIRWRGAIHAYAAPNLTDIILNSRHVRFTNLYNNRHSEAVPG